MTKVIFAVVCAVLMPFSAFAGEVKYSVSITSTNSKRFVCKINAETIGGTWSKAENGSDFLCVSTIVNWSGMGVGDDDICTSVFDKMGNLFSPKSNLVSNAFIEFSGIGEIGYVGDYFRQAGWSIRPQNQRSYQLTREK